jgi:hypothetical protein
LLTVVSLTLVSQVWPLVRVLGQEYLSPWKCSFEFSLTCAPARGGSGELGYGGLICMFLLLVELSILAVDVASVEMNHVYLVCDSRGISYVGMSDC